MIRVQLLSRLGAMIHEALIPPVDPLPEVLRWNNHTFIAVPISAAIDEEGRSVLGFKEATGWEMVDVEPDTRGGEARLTPIVEKTSPEIASLAGRGAANPGALSLDEIQKVCGSALGQAGS